nr:MAG TPA: hypothetical protein [Caudoviricetes sp.]
MLHLSSINISQYDYKALKIFFQTFLASKLKKIGFFLIFDLHYII